MLGLGARTVEFAGPRGNLSAAPMVSRAPHRPHPGRGSFNAGMASWYGRQFNHRVTASGERFDEALLTACHPTLPLGTSVRVTNLRNRRWVIVRINDRGPLAPGRVIDLSTAAADRLGMLQDGLVPVSLKIVARHS